MLVYWSNEWIYKLRLRQRLTAPDVWPYIVGLIALIALFSVCRPAWLTNDDVQMALIADGQGLAASATPHLVITNIAWGYLAYWFPDIGGIRSYAWISYIAIALAYVGTWLAFKRSEADHRLAALLMLLVYAQITINPQFSEIAGYLATASLLLACVAIATRALLLAAFAGVLIVLSGLVRMDEGVLVMLVASPLCLPALRQAWDSDLRYRWLAVAGITAVVFAGFWVLDYYSFSSGDWAYFASGYGLRDGFTDFGLGDWLTQHHASLEGSGFSLNDLHLLRDWFSLDPNVYSPDKMGALAARIPWQGHVHATLTSFLKTLEPFYYPFTIALCAVLAGLLVCLRPRGPLLLSLLLFAAVMLALWLAGRPGIFRIYSSVFVCIALLSILQLGKRRHVLHGLLLVVAVVATGGGCLRVFMHNQAVRHATAAAHAATCSLAQGSLMLTWGGHYPFVFEYPVFQRKQDDCPLDYYPFGQFSLAPFALDQLHRYTGGKDFVPAILAGQSFDIIADERDLEWLQTYFADHYSVQLMITPKSSSGSFDVFTIGLHAPAVAR